MGSIIGAGKAHKPGEFEVEPDDGLLSPGDTVEVGISSLYRQGGIECWLKVGCTVAVRPGEQADEAFDRGHMFAISGITEAIAALSNDD
jgi:hypothetical protein